MSLREYPVCELMILSSVTDKDIETINNDTERDYFMDSKEALEYGIVDKILEKRD